MECTNCGRTNRIDARFCDGCGAALGAGAAVEAVARKVVTIIFADLIGSTSLHERLDAESVRRLMERYYRALHGAVAVHGGTVVKLLGDGVMAAFGVPRVAEDDAIRAVRTAVGMQRAFRELVGEQAGGLSDVGLRVAVNTGEVVVSSDNADVVGDPVNVAARLQQEARDGDVLIGESTRRLVGHLVTLAPVGDLSLKGRSEAVAAYRVVSLDRPAGAAATPFVGRDDELRRVTAVYDAAVAAPAGRLVVILGSPGLGKSRLIDELARRLGDRATVLSAPCDATGGATFAPLAEALRAALGIDEGAGSAAVRAAIDAALPGVESEPARIASGVAALLAGTPAAPEETFFVVRRLLGGLAARRPVVLAIDDAQWAAPLLLDLAEHLVQWSTGVPLLVLLAARPELRDTRSSLAEPVALVSDVVTLGGLDAAAATRLAANVIGADALPAAVAGRVLATSEGNPLFVGELVRMLVQDGALRRDGERWSAAVELGALEMPPTIHALLAARIERLRPEERSVLERAAVVGRQFSRAAIAHMLPPEIGDIDARLEALRRSELIEPDTGWFVGEPALRFHHVLIRDAAYRRLLKGTRAELHVRFADWLDARVGDAAEHDETKGWHLEQAHQHLRELGPVDERGRAFGERAARYLAAAGRRALARDDVPVAARLLGRAIERLDAADARRADLALDWCEALLAGGDVGPAARAIAELGRFSGESDRLRAWHTCFAGQLAVLTDPQALRATADLVAAAAETLESAGDAAGQAKAHAVHAAALARLGKIGASEAALDRALAAARQAGDRRRSNAVLAGAPVAALWGPSPVTRASGRCLDVVRVLRITQGDPTVEAVALRCQAVLEALRGRAAAARRMMAASRHLVEELGITQRLLEVDVFAGIIELLEGNAVAAERCLRAAYDGLRDHGLGVDAAQAAALLGRALLAQGRGAEAEAMSHESEALAGDDLKAGIVWRGVRAEALAQRGEHHGAIGFARAAVDLAAATDDLLDHADARLALASALRAAGHGDEARAEEVRAIELWEAKGATLLAARARGDGGAAGDAVVETGGPLSELECVEADARAGRARSGGPTAGAAAGGAVVPGRRADAARLVQANGAMVKPLGADEPPAVPFANAAVRAVERFERCWRERDWDGVLATHASTHQVDDRRALLRMRLPAERSFASLRYVFAMPSIRWGFDVLATRGERLALCAVRISGEASAGSDILVDYLSVIEVDSDGRQVAIVIFDPGDLDAGYDELAERYTAGEAASSRRATVTRVFSDAFAARDWQTLATVLADDLVVHDHRVLGWETLHGPAAYVEALRSLVELAPDVRLRIDHISMSEPGFLYATTFLGSREGGAFEAPSVIVCEIDHSGRIRRFDQYDPDQIEVARARLNAIAAKVTDDPLAALVRPNAATAAADRVQAAFDARDWSAMRAACAPGATFEDRRRHALLTGDADWWVADAQGLVRATPDVRYERRLLATAGERVVLERVLWSGDAGSGRVEVEYCRLTEVDDSGRVAAVIGFDLADWRAARREAWARWFSVDPSAESVVGPVFELAEAIGDHDRDRARAVLADDMVMDDHRRTGLGRLDGADAYLRGIAVLWDLAPDVQLDTAFEIAREPYGAVGLGRFFGMLRDGGAFEYFVVAVTIVARRRITRFEIFELADVDAALARFAELRPVAT